MKQGLKSSQTRSPTNCDRATNQTYSGEKKMTTIDKVLFIIENTNDGNKLSGKHLKLTELCVNGFANEAGLQELDRVYEMVANNQYVDWFYGIENLTKDAEGYVYWKGQHLDHYSYRGDYEAEELAAKELAETCRQLEAEGIEVNAASYRETWAK
jgi:hypothetical protein